MRKLRPPVMSVAGFDPSGGAGILADIKTFESLKVYGIGVCSCITFQNEDEFAGLEWMSIENITRQIDILFKKYHPGIVKIGLIRNFLTLDHIIDHLLSHDNKIKIIWDPVLGSGTSFDFEQKFTAAEIEIVCNKIYMLTPNYPEMQQLLNSLSPEDSAKQLSKYCNIFLKGGHNTLKPCYDYLYTNEKSFSFRPRIKSLYNKHGSGCVLSSAIVAFLAKGFKLHKACVHAKYYITGFFESNSSLIGYHKL